MPRKKKIDYIYTVGRRKSASARVRLFKGRSQSSVNNVPFDEYFPGKIFEDYFKKPFELTETLGKYYVTVRVLGGGRKGQLEATVHGIARSLAKLDSEKFRSPLKKAGLLTRDSRVRERRKVGTGGKARRKKQSPKR